jgi:parallel beta-helix repeat protein
MTSYSQPGIVFATDNLGLGYGMSPTNLPLQNAKALQKAIDTAQAMANPNGAMVVIPSFAGTPSSPIYGSYQIEVPPLASAAVNIPDTGSSASPLLICGTGLGTTLQMSTAGGILFNVSSNSYVTFQDLTVVYEVSGGVGGVGTAFNFNSAPTGTSEGYRLFRINISDCKNAIVLGNNQDELDLLQCNVSYDSAYPPAQDCTGIYVSSAESNIAQCLLTYAVSSSTGTTIGIHVVGNSLSTFRDTQISGFATGINVTGQSNMTATGNTFTAVQVDATGSCVVIGGHVYDLSFVDCSFEPTASSSPSTAAIVLSASQNGILDTVRFTSCRATGYPAGQYGLQIEAGQNIQVNGGDYSGNGSAGIAVTGAATEIQINGANCVGPSFAGNTTATNQQYGIYIIAGQDIQITNVNCSGNGLSGTTDGTGIFIDGFLGSLVQDVRIIGAICAGPVLGNSTVTQQYGIYVASATGVVIDGVSATGNTQYGIYLVTVTNVTVSNCDLYSNTTGGLYISVQLPTQVTKNVFVRGCNCTGYSGGYSSAINVNNTFSALQNIQITNCSGYNDQGVRLATTAPSGAFSGSISYNYYGPTAFYVVTSGSTIKVDTYTTLLTQGAFTLSPGETAQISGGTVSNFLMIGK